MKYKLLILFLLVSILLHSQDYKINLWNGKVPNNKETKESEKWDTTDFVRVSNVQIPDIAVYLPSKRIATRQAVVICPGGAYMRLAYQWEGIEIAKWLNSKGIAAIILKYRLPVSSNNIVSYESPLLDAKRALRLVRYNASKWNIDTAKVGIMGFSAGGHLAASLVTHFDYGNPFSDDPIERLSSRPNFAILMYPVISMYEPDVHKGSRENLLGKNPSEELLKNFSNEFQVKSDTPPVFIVHASDDKTVPVNNSLLFYKALIDKGISAEMHIYPFGGHGFSLGLDKEYLNSWTDRCIDWLKWLNQKK